MALTVILFRFVQFSGAAILFGVSFFMLYSPLLEDPDPPRWTRRLLTGAAMALTVAAPLGFLFQLSALAGSISAAMEPAAWHTALLEMNFGKSSLVRFALALAALAICAARPSGRYFWWICTALGAAICASFAWMGHGAATEGAGGWVHLAADIVHSLAAAGWIGALAVFCIALRPAAPLDARRLHAALTAFSGVGSGLVAAIILTGLVNSGFLVGWDVKQALSTRYGQVLAAKLGLFVLMLAFAAINRYRLTPSLGSALSSPAVALAHLRRSIRLETEAAFAVIALVSWLGTLPPARG